MEIAVALSMLTRRFVPCEHATQRRTTHIAMPATPFSQGVPPDRFAVARGAPRLCEESLLRRAGWRNAALATCGLGACKPPLARDLLPTASFT